MNPLRRLPLAQLVFTGLVLLALSTTARWSATEEELLPVPDPTLEGMDSLVQDQLREELESVRSLADDATTPSTQVGEAFGDLGRLYLAYDLVSPAEVCLLNARQLDPGSSRWAYLLGALYQGDRRLDEAVTSLTTALDLGGDDLATLVRLGNVHLARDAPWDARPVFERARLLKPTEAAPLAGLARVAATEGDPAAAVDLFRAALDRQPQASSLRYPLGLALRELGRVDEARTELARRGSAEVSFPDPVAQELLGLATGAGIHLMFGHRAMRLGQVEAALARYQQALEANPRSAEVHQALGSVASRLGELDRAVEHYSAALALAPDDPSLHYNLGTVLVEKGQDEQAIRHFRAALELAEDYHNARFNLATALAKQERFEEAEPHWRRLLETEENDPATRFYAAHTYFRLGRNERAAILLEGLVAEDGHRTRARLLLARLRLTTGDPDAARQQFEAVLATPGGDPESRHTARLELARLAGRGGRFDEAVALYDVLLSERPDDDEARFARAMALLLAERYGEARKRLEEAAGRPGAGSGPFLHLLARFLATCPEPALRDGQRAFELARDLFRSQPRPEVAETLAMALAELGRFDDAIAWQQRLIAEAERAGAGAMVPTLAERLTQYQRHDPVRAPWLESVTPGAASENP